MRYLFTLFGWAVKLHFLKWSRYRLDVFIWIVSIWLTLGIQVVFVYVTYGATDGDLFGYTPQDIYLFFGMMLLATGIAQSIVHGIVLYLAKAVWSGEFDYWLLQPAPIFMRMLITDMGIIWFFPHILVGAGILLYVMPQSFFFLLLISVLAAAIEGGLILCLSIPAIRFGRWDPNEGLWEYIEGSRSIPIGRSKAIFLWVASFGVLQYSISLSVVTDSLRIWHMGLLAATICGIAALLLHNLVRHYQSASS